MDNNNSESNVYIILEIDKKEYERRMPLNVETTDRNIISSTRIAVFSDIKAKIPEASWFYVARVVVTDDSSLNKDVVWHKERICT